MITIFVFLPLVLLASTRARADWVEDGIPVCTASGYQTAIRATTGGCLTWRRRTPSDTSSSTARDTVMTAES
jgi:hypothetical protein